MAAVSVLRVDTQRRTALSLSSKSVNVVRRSSLPNTGRLAVIPCLPAEILAARVVLKITAPRHTTSSLVAKETMLPGTTSVRVRSLCMEVRSQIVSGQPLPAKVALPVSLPLRVERLLRALRVTF